MSLQNKHVNPHGGNSYSPHDLSHQLKFTSSVGMLLPVYFDLLSPGDKVEISPSMFSRLQNMTSPAFTRLTEHIDFFSVPCTQIWSLFDAFFHQVRDFKSSSLLPLNVGSVPMAELKNLSYGGGSSTPDPYPDMFGGNSYGGSLRLMDLLQYGHNAASDLTTSTLVNPMVMCAYQKIYQDFYRLSTREEKDVLSYQLDKFSTSSVNLTADLQRIFKLRYRPWKQDYFTNIEPTPLVTPSSIGIMDFIDGTYIPDWLTDSYVSVGGQTPDPSDNDQATTVYGQTLYPDSTAEDNTVSTDVLRKMFSFEKLIKLTQRAGKTVDLQQLAHFGVRYDKYLAGKVEYLGSSHGVIAVDSVVAQDQSTTVNLGQLGGKAQGVVNPRTIKHTCGNAGHEIIMAIYSCVPESDYSSLGINRIHTYRHPEDYYHPEFDQLGMQPLFGYESDFGTDPSDNSTVLGWTERWRELKQKYDRVSAGLLTNWKNWVTQRVVRNNQLATFYINPNMLDSIMLVPYLDSYDDSTSGLTYDKKNPWKTDPLIHLLHFDSKKLSQMSVHTDKIGL